MSVSHTFPAGLLALGVFDRSDAARWGVGPDAIRRGVRSGRLRAVRRGWDTATVSANVEEQHLLVATAVRREIGLPLTGLSALVHHGLPVFALADVPVQLSGPPDRRRSRAGIVITPPLGGAHRLDPTGEAVTVDDALVVAALFSPEHALPAADQALRAARTTADALAGRLSEAGRRRGSLGARQALALADGRRESVGESRLAWHAHGWGIPLVPQVVIRTGSGTYRVDFLVEGSRVIVEFDGLTKYVDRTDLRAEKHREDALRQAGYVVIRVTWGDLYRPEVLRRRLLDVLPPAVAA